MVYTGEMTPTEEEEATQLLVELIQFRTVSGSAPHDGSYNRCASWILSQLERIGLDSVFTLKESLGNKPIVIGTWIGSKPV